MEELKVLDTLSEDEAYLFAILSDASGLDQAEFLWVDGSSEDHLELQPDGTKVQTRPSPSGCFRAWPYQWAWWRSIGALHIDQCARALAVDTPIPTPTGWTTMGGLQPGDYVYDEAGFPTLVTAVSQVWTDRPCYDVCFDDHTSIVADGEHLWSTWDKTARMALKPRRRGTGAARVRTTNEIRASLHYGKEKNHAIDVTGPLQAAGAVLPIDPYFLGYWLGDGNSNTSEITTADGWVLDEIERRGMNIVPRAAALHYGVRWPHEHNRKTASVQADLRRLGVLCNKHIPDAYLRGSEVQRRDLLAGLVDSDGHMQSNGSCEITQKNQRIAEGLIELLRSLGEKPRVGKRTAWMNGIDCGPVYRITWRPRVNPALMPRKHAAFVEPGRVSALAQRRIVDVREVPTRPVRCITVASPNHLFLAGEGMIPTHNSVGKSLSIMVRACAFPFLFPGQEMVITAPELVHLEPIVSLIEGRIYATRALREMMPRGKSAVTHRPFQCVAAGQFVLTLRGQVPIEEVEIGDQVLTHRNRWRPVTAVWDRGMRPVVKVRAMGVPGLRVTPDHKLWAATMKQKESRNAEGKRKMIRVQQAPRWIAPQDWRVRDPAHRIASPAEFDTVEIPQSERWIRLNKRGFGVGHGALIDVLTEDFMWVFGLYAAEGCTWGDNLVILSVHQKEIPHVVERLAACSLKGYVNNNKGALGANVRLTNIPLREWFERNMPGGSITRDIPAWLFGLDDALRQAFFEGYLYGDGHETVLGHQHPSTSSHALALSLRLMANQFGYGCGVYPVPAKTSQINGLDVFSKERWELHINYDPYGGRHQHSFFDEGHVWTAATKIEDDGEAHVFDLTVEEDHSFVAEGVVVSNCNFTNGSRIIGRIPQRDGRGVKGIHPIWLELDEAQDYPHAGWVELRETLKRGFEGATWRAHGVTKGVRDDFYEFTQDSPENPWRVHRFAAMWRPNWTDEERTEAILKYGSREDPDYRRNILGLHGDKTNPIFVLTQLMKNVDNDKLSDYNSNEYYKAMIKVEQLEMWGQDITEVLDFPAGHLSYAGQNAAERSRNSKAIYWCGMDIGFTIDPSEILVFVEYREKPRDPHTKLRLLTRISLVRMPHREQIQAILHTIDFYKPKTFAMDKAGNGLPLFQEMQEHIDAFRSKDWDHVPTWMRRYDLEYALTTIKGYNFSEKLVVDFDKSVELTPYADQDDVVAQSGMKRNAKEYATDILREMVDRSQLWLPWDEDLLKQFQGGTWTSSRSMDAYGRRTFSRGNDHVLDAAREFALGWAQSSIEEMLRKDVAEPVYDAFIAM